MQNKLYDVVQSYKKNTKCHPNDSINISLFIYSGRAVDWCSFKAKLLLPSLLKLSSFRLADTLSCLRSPQGSSRARQFLKEQTMAYVLSVMLKL